MTDTMTRFLDVVRACWLVRMPCEELMEACETEMFRDVVLHEYGRLEMAFFIVSTGWDA